MPVAVWDVFWVREFRGASHSKGKYVIIIATTPRIVGFLISSNLPRNLNPESKIALAYAGISPADTEPPFLRHNSFVGCVEFSEFEEYELSVKKAILLPDARRRVKDAAQQSRMTRKDKIKVNQAFSSG